MIVRGSVNLLQGAQNLACRQYFSIHAIFKHHIVATIRNNELWLLDLKADGRFHKLLVGSKMVGPVFTSADGSEAFVVQTRQTQAAVQRLVVNSEEGIHLADRPNIPRSRLNLDQLMAGTSCLLVLGLSASTPQPPRLILIDINGRGASCDISSAICT